MDIQTFTFTYTEIVTISISIIFPAIAIFISVLAYRRSGVLSSVRNQVLIDNAGKDRQLTILSAHAKHHAEYSKLLTSTEKDIKSKLSDLSDTAYRVHTRLGEVLDVFDKEKNHSRYARHIFDNIIIEIRNTYDAELLRQYGGNLRSQLSILSYVLDDIKPSALQSRLSRMLSWFEFKGKSHDYDVRPAEKLYSSTSFAEKILALSLRVPDEQNLFKQAEPILNEYFKEFDAVRPDIRRAIDNLEDALKKNEHETFKLSDNHDLHFKLNLIIKKLKVLHELGLPEVKGLIGGYVYSPLSQLIYTGGTLAIVSDYAGWGRQESM